MHFLWIFGNGLVGTEQCFVCGTLSFGSLSSFEYVFFVFLILFQLGVWARICVYVTLSVADNEVEWDGAFYGVCIVAIIRTLECENANAGFNQF